MIRGIFVLFLLAGLWGCANRTTNNTTTSDTPVTVPAPTPVSLEDTHDGLSKAVFASGCFWCTEAVFERVAGVKDVVSGYAGGSATDATYKKVAAGLTDHAEAVIVKYDPQVISYSTLVEVFFASHDPTQVNRQGPDVGRQYRSEIFYATDEEREIAQRYKSELDGSGKYSRPIATNLSKLETFYPAEDYHQNYYELNPNQSYVYNVSRPKVEKFMKEYPQLLKPKYRKQVEKG